MSGALFLEEVTLCQVYHVNKPTLCETPPTALSSRRKWVSITRWPSIGTRKTRRRGGSTPVPIKRNLRKRPLPSPVSRFRNLSLVRGALVTVTLSGYSQSSVAESINSTGLSIPCDGVNRYDNGERTPFDSSVTLEEKHNE